MKIHYCDDKAHPDPSSRSKLSAKQAFSDKSKCLLIGCDVATKSQEIPTRGFVAGVMMIYPSLDIFGRNANTVTITRPYRTGYLAEREGSAMISLIAKMLSNTSQNKTNNLPVVAIIDGAGELHPRKFGLACHVGKYLDLPTIGITKSYLVGNEIPESKKTIRINGNIAKITAMELNGKIAGWKVQKIDHISDKCLKPIYVSVGYSISLDSAVKLTIGTLRYRIPEPVRLADQLARQETKKTK